MNYILRAAEILESYAEELRASHTVLGIWPLLDEADERAHADYEEMVAVAKGLRDGVA